MDSILISIKSMLGVQEEFTGFDGTIMSAINTAIFSLNQVGIGPVDGMTVVSTDQTWSELYDGVSNLEAVKSYIYLKTKLIFDPPATSFLLQSIDSQMTEALWRLSIEVEPDYVSEE